MERRFGFAPTLRSPSVRGSSVKCPASRGFTLVELLAVVAIMAILLVAAMPVFQMMGKRDVDSAAANLRATLRLARQFAVTQRRQVFVVFPDNSSAAPGHVDMILRSYAALATNSAGGYEYVSEWRYLPQGVFLDDTPTLTGSPWNTAHMEPRPFPFPSPSGGDRVMPALSFKPDGRPYGYGGSTGGRWGNKDVSCYLTTARYGQPNASDRLDISHIAGTTNNVRVRAMTGQVDLRKD